MSNQWVTHDGRIAHPASPVGGGGPGRGRIPKSLSDHETSGCGIPHPDSPRGRYLHPHHALAEIVARKRAKHIPRRAYKPQAPTSPIPPAKHLREARTHIMNWVASEEKPHSEWERVHPANIDTPEHNFRVAYAINYAFEAVGVHPNKAYSPKQIADLATKALWRLTSDLRRADEHVDVSHRIGTSESLVLRDAQRYLYGLQGPAWLQKDIEKQYHIPEIIAEHSSVGTIDGTYNFVKSGALLLSAAVEEIRGTSPGFMRTGAKLPLSRPGGEAWLNLGEKHYALINQPQGHVHVSNPLLSSVPTL